MSSSVLVARVHIWLPLLTVPHSSNLDGRSSDENNLLQLGSEEGVLLAKGLRRFEDVVQDVKHVFAQGLVGIVALEARVWAATRRDVRDDDRVDIASRTGDLESVDGTVFMACVAVQFGALGAR